MTTDALAAKLNYDTYKLNSMTTYKELAATGRILWAVERDDSGNWQDVTERERAIQELQQAKKDLEMARLTAQQAQQAQTLHVATATATTSSFVEREEND